MTFRLPRVNIVVSDVKGFDATGSISTLSIGYGLHLAWMHAAVFGSASLFDVPSLVEFLGYPAPHLPVTELALVSQIVFAITMLVIGLTDQRFLRICTSKTAAFASGAVCALGTLAMFAAAQLSFFGFVMMIVSAALTGAASAMLALFWGTAYARCSSSSIVINTVIAVITGICLYSVLLYIVPDPFAGIITALLPLLELPLLRSKAPESYIKSSSVPLFNPLPVRRRAFALRFGVPVLVAGFSLGSLSTLSNEVIIPTPELSLNALAVIGACGVLILIVGVLLIAGLHRYWDSLFRVVLPLIMVTVCFIPLALGERSTAASIAVMVGSLCLEALMWMFFAQLCQTFRLSATLIFGIGQAMLAAGSFLGTIALINPDFIDSLTPYGRHSGVLLCMAALVISYMFLPRVRDIKRMVDPDFERRHTPLDDINAEIAELDAIVNDRPQPAANKAVAPFAEDGSAQPRVTTETAAGSAVANPAENAPDTFAEVAKASDAVPDADVSARDLTAEPAQPDALHPLAAAQSEAKLAMSRPKNDADAANTSDRSRGGRFRTKCEEIANTYLLSRRETEVLFLLAKGYNAAYIQKKLCITQSTAKTHIYHIYQKLGIHTQQEILTMVSDEDEA